MPPTVIPSSSSTGATANYSHNNVYSHNLRKDLYSSAHLGTSTTGTSGTGVKRQRSSTVESPPLPGDGHHHKTTVTDRSHHNTTTTSASILKSPPTPARKQQTLQKKPAAVSSLSIKTHRKTASTTTAPTSRNAPALTPLTPTLASRPPTSFGLASPLSPTSPQLKKKAPARFSSNGISTTSGPPPSLAYRNTNIIEQQVSSSSRASSQKTPQTPTSASRLGGSTDAVVIRGGGGIKSTPATPAAQAEARRQQKIMPPPPRPAAPVQDEDRTIRGLEDIPREGRNSPQVNNNSNRNNSYDDGSTTEEDEDTAMTDADSSKDLFLSLAKADPPNLGRGLLNTRNRLEERKARIAQRASLPASGTSSFTSNASDMSPKTTSLNSHRKSVPVPMVDTLAEAMQHGPRVSSLRHESSTGLEREHLTSSSSNNRSFGATLNPSPLQSDRTIASMIDQDRKNALPTGGSFGGGEADTASTVSTNAASVWDELDDLKSRIRKLEMTGGFAGQGKGTGTSESSGGRPRTATTTATTLSSSPRNNYTSGLSPQGAGQNAIHPLLHSALSKSKPHLAPEVYKSLEATAKDAFAIADLVGSQGTAGGVMPSSSPPSQAGASQGAIADRQLRRKVDSLCRSLTELCIALSEARSHIANATVAAASPPSAVNNSSLLPHMHTPPSSLTVQHPHLLGVRPLTRDGVAEREISSRFLDSRSGRDSVLSDRRILGGATSAASGRFSTAAAVIAGANSTEARRPSLQNLSMGTDQQNSLAPGLSTLQQSVSYSEIAARRPSAPASEIMPASKLARASMLMKARREQMAAAAAAAGGTAGGDRDVSGRRTVADVLSRDGQVDHIMQDLDLQDAGQFRTPSRATTDVLRSRRQAMAHEREREREVEQLTGQLRRPSLFHNRTSSSATVTQATITNGTNSTTQPQRSSPLSQLRTSRINNDGDDTSIFTSTNSSADRLARRAQLTRSMQEGSISVPLTPVEPQRRFFDEDGLAARRVGNRNTIHTDNYISIHASPRYSTVAAAGGAGSVELKRKSQPTASALGAGRALRAATEYGTDIDMDGMGGLSGGQSAGVIPDRSFGSSEGRRFLRRRVE